MEVSKDTDVTIMAPLALTHRNMTWFGVIPRRLAAELIGASTGPPGNLVIGLLGLVRIRKNGSKRTRDYCRLQ